VNVNDKDVTATFMPSVVHEHSTVGVCGGGLGQSAGTHSLCKIHFHGVAVFFFINHV